VALSLEDLVNLGMGKRGVSVEGTGAAEAIKDAQYEADVAAIKKEKLGRKEAAAARRAAAYGPADANRKGLAPGMDKTLTDQVKGTGPENPGFDLLAKSAPEKAAAEVDKYEQAYGLAPRASAPGTDDIYTDAPARAGGRPEMMKYNGAVEGLRGVDVRRSAIRQEFGGTADDAAAVSYSDKPGAGMRPVDTGLGNVSAGVNEEQMDPRRREVVQRIRMARDQIALGEKSQDVVDKEVVKHLPGAISDLKKLGPEEAGKKWLGMVASGDLSDAAYRRIGAESAEEAKRQDESAYAKTREKYIDTARETGVGRAIDVINKNRKYGKSDPQHLARIEQELRHLGKSSLDPEAILTPNAFLPLSKADVGFFRRGGNNTPTKSDKPDADAPPTISNVHNGKTTLQLAGEQAQAGADQVEQRVTAPDIVGKPARPLSSYLGLTGATGAPEPANTSGNTVPTAETALSFLEGGGNVQKGRELRKKRGRTLDETRNSQPPFKDMPPQVGETKKIPGGQATAVGAGTLGYQINPESELMAWLLRGGRSK